MRQGDDGAAPDQGGLSSTVLLVGPGCPFGHHAILGEETGAARARDSAAFGQAAAANINGVSGTWWSFSFRKYCARRMESV